MAPISFYDAVYEVVRAIPARRVSTYGTIATWLGSPRAARAVGYALAADGCGDIPWHRVVNHRGSISEGGAPWRPGEQRRRLEAEGLHFSPEGHLALKDCCFRPTNRQLQAWNKLGEKIRLIEQL